VRVISSLPFGVHHCSVLPHKATDDLFVETEATPTHEGPIRLSLTAIRELARTAGLPTEESHAALLERVEGLEAELVEAHAELLSLREFEQAATYSLEHLGSKVRKKPGRKPREEAPVG
jgi:hypothetical protein